jgi:hypothetical protein
MTSVGRIGEVSINVQGHWDISDLLSLSEIISESYGLFYPLVSENNEITERLHNSLRTTFWSVDVDVRHIGRILYRQIPSDEALKLKSFAYASPGSLELSGVLGCLWMLSRVARSWIKTGDDFLSLWARIEKFFGKRKDLKKTRRQIKLDAEMAISVDGARELCF